MKFHWSTSDVVADLRTIEGVDNVDVHPCGGDVDSENLVIHVGEEVLHVSAFCFEDYSVDPIDYDFDAVEVTDRSGDGLQSNDETLALVYVRVREYFSDKGAEVVRRMRDYF